MSLHNRYGVLARLLNWTRPLNVEFQHLPVRDLAWKSWHVVILVLCFVTLATALHAWNLWPDFAIAEMSWWQTFSATNALLTVVKSASLSYSADTSARKFAILPASASTVLMSWCRMDAVRDAWSLSKSVDTSACHLVILTKIAQRLPVRPNYVSTVDVVKGGLKLRANLTQIDLLLIAMLAVGKSREKLASPQLLEAVKISLLTRTRSSLSTTLRKQSNLLKRTWLGFKSLSHIWRTSCLTKARSTTRIWLVASALYSRCWSTSTLSLTCVSMANPAKSESLMSSGKMAAKFQRLCARKLLEWSPRVSKK